MNDTICCNCNWVGDAGDTIIVEDDRGSVCPKCGCSDLVDYDPEENR